MRLFFHVCLAAALLMAGDAAAANGKAVCISWRYGAVPENPLNGFFNWWGKLVRFDITNNKVIGNDTLFKQTLAMSPALNISGTKVAFARWAFRVSGNSVAGPRDSAYLSIMDINGGTPVDLLVFKAKWALDGSGGLADDGAIIDWPAGDWIYYEKPCKTAEIWKVKFNDPLTNQLVCKYAGPTCDKGGQILYYFRRWSLSLDCKYAASQSCSGNLLHAAFPANGNISSVMPTDGGRPGCNIQISPSGNYSGRYGGGWHTEINIEEWNHSTNAVIQHYADGLAWNPSLAQAQTYLGRPIGVGAAELRWSANSDKWICQTIGWYGHESTLSLGGDQLLTNWKDNQAILTTNNPKQPVHTPENWPLDGVIYYCGNVGDFWVEPPAGVANAYEDLTGAWRSIAGTNAENGRDLRTAPRDIAIRKDAGGIIIHAPGAFDMRVSDLAGRLVLSRRATGSAFIGAAHLPAGVCVVRVIAGSAQTMKVL